MKKKILVSSFYFVLFFFITLVVSTQSHASFVKHPSNPILNIGTNGTWDDIHISEPHIIFDYTGYALWYGGYDGTRWATGNAISGNGVNWTKDPFNPLLAFVATDPQEQHVHTPSVIKVGSLYKIWYTSSPDDVSNFKIEYAESTTGTSFTRFPGSTISPTQSWESQGVANPSVVKIDNTYYMWYSGLNAGIWRIGYATSPDGISWTKHLNPILQPTLSWEGSTVAAPSVIFIDSVFHIYYHAGPVSPKYLGHATSTDGINWNKDPNPILERGGFASWDSNLIASPGVIRITNKLKLYYTGHDGANFRIGLAEEKLPVPYFAQNDSLWGSDQYDSADVWANPSSRTMSAVGCAVTSAAMILKHFNVQKTPGNPDTGLSAKELTPGTLNEWLQSRNDGTFRNGATNWALIGTMTKLANELDPTSPKLEYFSSPSASLASVVGEELPAILNLDYPPSPSDTHFVVATASESATYSINDPFYEDRTTLAPNYDTINRLGYFKPTNSDFSYLSFVFDASVSAVLKDSDGNPVGEVVLEKPIFDQVNQIPSGAPPLKIISIKQPATGLYTLELSAISPQSFRLDSYLYDQAGKNEMETFRGNLVPGYSHKLYLRFDHNEIQNSDLFIGYDHIRQHIEALYQAGKIKTKAVYRKLLFEVNKVESMAKKGPTGVKTRLEGVLTYIGARRGKYLTEEAYQIIKTDILNLIGQF